LRAEIKKLQDTPVSAGELEKAKNQIVTSQLRQRETSLGKSQALGRAAVLLGDPNRVNTDLEHLQAVTAADVQRVAKKYFTDSNAYVFYYLPESARPKPGDQTRTTSSANGETQKVAKAIDTPLLCSDGDKINVVSAPRAGEVTVQVLIDEQGKVIQAKAVSGDPELSKIAEKAARQARFTPKLLSGKPVKVNGVLTYHFTAQEEAKK